MMRYRIVAYIFIATMIAGCDVIRAVAPMILPQQAMPVATHTPYPTATPQAAATITFRVRVPVNTPSGSSISILFPDLVGGQSHRTIILTSAGDNIWTANTTAPVGSILRYRIQRTTGPQLAVEVLSNGDPIGYRTFFVNAATVTADDTVAAWSDTPFIGASGRVQGFVRDGSSNRGLPSMIVSAGGQQTVSGFDGEYVIWNIPAGTPISVVAFAPDGAFRAVMGVATVPANEAANLDMTLWAAKTVNVTFVVAPPAGLPPNAIIRVAGNIPKLGETFILNQSGSSIAPQRQAVLTPLGDGKWSLTLPMYEGTDLRYKYTLGNAFINAEMGFDGSPLVRQIVVPGDDDIILNDQVGVWHASVNQPVTFSVNVPANTPPTDEVTLQLNFGNGWLAPVPMWRDTPTRWSYVLYNPVSFAGQTEYRFCRNYQCGTADDTATAGAQPAGFRFIAGVLPQYLQNNVNNWQWLADAPTPALNIPPVAARAGFHAGFEIAPVAPADLPTFAYALDAMKSDSANWVRIPVVWDMPTANPPQITFDNSQTFHNADLIALIRLARERGFKVALYPQVRPSANGVYGGNLNAYFDAGTKDKGWWDGWFRQYARFLAYYSDIAAFTGVELLYVGDSSLARALPGGADAPEDADTRWREIITAIRRDHYNAPMAFGITLEGVSPALSVAPPPFLDAVDVIDVRLSAALGQQAGSSATELNTNAATLLDGIVLPLYDQFKKPVVITAIYPSVDGGATGCLGSLGSGCQPYSRIAPDQPDSPQFPLDLDEQRLAYEAVLTAMAGRPWVAGFYGYGYSVPAVLRDKYFSPRGKPAEALLAAWFPRMK